MERYTKEMDAYRERLQAEHDDEETGAPFLIEAPRRVDKRPLSGYITFVQHEHARAQSQGGVTTTGEIAAKWSRMSDADKSVFNTRAAEVAAEEAAATEAAEETAARRAAGSKRAKLGPSLRAQFRPQPALSAQFDALAASYGLVGGGGGHLDGIHVAGFPGGAGGGPYAEFNPYAAYGPNGPFGPHHPMQYMPYPPGDRRPAGQAAYLGPSAASLYAASHYGQPFPLPYGGPSEMLHVAAGRGAPGAVPLGPPGAGTGEVEQRMFDSLLSLFDDGIASTVQDLSAAGASLDLATTRTT